MTMSPLPFLFYTVVVGSWASLHGTSVSADTAVVWSALDYSDALELSPEHYGQCGSGPVDAQPTTDQICIERDGAICNVGWTEPGEYLEYSLEVTTYDDFDIWVRVAANHENRRIRIELDPAPVDAVGDKTFTVRNEGWQNFNDIVWDLVWLEPNHYTVRVHFLDGFVNMCSVAVKPSTSRYNLYTPGTYGAMMYIDYDEKSTEKFGNCPFTRYGGITHEGVDTQYTNDPICCEAIRDTEDCCNIGWTERNEALYYSFDLDGNHRHIDLSLRVASRQAYRRVKVTVSSGVHQQRTATLTTPGKGYSTYETVEWNNVDVLADDVSRIGVWVEFLDGRVNLCSIGVKYSS